MARDRYAGLSFEQAVAKYSKNVLTACLIRLQNTPDAEDCTQNTFIKLYKKSPDFNDEEHLKAWLLRVAVNECRHCLRDNKRLVSLDSVKEYPLPESDDTRDISWALMRLPPNYREVLYLYYIERYKVDEIAAILDAKSGTVKSLLKRGRDKLRELYGGDKK